MLTRPRSVMRSASGPASSSRRHTGSEPPAGTSSISPSRRSLPPALLAALPLRLGARTMAPSSRCEAADSSTSWVSVSFIGILRSVCDSVARRHHQSPHWLECRRGRSRDSLLLLHRARTVTLCLEGKSSPFWSVLSLGSAWQIGEYLPARDLFGIVGAS